MHRSFCGLVFALLLAVTSGHRLEAQSHSRTLSSPEKLFGLSKLWHETGFQASVSNNPYRTDADSLFMSYISQVIKSANDYEYYRLLQRYAATFEEAHTRVEMPASISDSLVSVPIRIQEIRGRYYVTDIDRKYLDKIPIGSEIIRINGSDVRSYIESEVLPYISGSTLQGRMHKALERITEGWINTRFIIQYLTPDGREQNEIFTRTKQQKIRWVKDTGEDQDVVRTEWINRETALITLQHFNEESVKRFPKPAQLERATHIIIDLRNNHSEDLGSAITIAIQLFDTSAMVLPGFIIPETAVPFTGLTGDQFNNFGKRDHPLSAERIALPDTIEGLQRKPGAPGLILLTGAGTGNAAEHFIMFVKQRNKKAILVGEPTAGSTGAGIAFELPGQSHGFVWSRKDFYVYPTRPLTDIHPDYSVSPDVKSLLNGEDPVLNQALMIIR